MGTAIQDSWWLQEFCPAKGVPVDYLSLDGKTAVELRETSYGTQGLYSAAMHMATFLERASTIQRGCLVLRHTRLSLPRLKQEWQAIKRVLKGPITQRLCLIVVEKGETWLEPDEPYVRRIAHVFENSWSNQDEVQWADVPQSPGQLSNEIVKVLLGRWLSEQGPISIRELQKEVGCSYPTVRKTLKKQSLQGVLAFKSNRSVELKAFPHDAWRELLTLSITQRTSFRFRDRSGEKPSPQSLLKRLEQAKPSHVALGGVLAARHWHPDFDLHGTPRLDLVYHAPSGKVDLDFVGKLDPALTPIDDPAKSAVLVIHPLVRAASLFTEKTKQGIPWADPVETALDLGDLSLTTQANQLLTHLRPEVRLK